MRSWRLVGAGVILACALGWGAPPAGADEGVRLSGTAGWAGRCRVGRPVLLRVRIEADRLVSGVLSAQAGPVRTEIPVEVTGGSQEEVTLVVSSPFGCGEVGLRLQEARGTTTAQVGATDAGDTVLLGLLPGTRRGGRPPASALARTGVAAVDSFEPDVLDRPGAVAGLDSIGVTPADLDGLSTDQRTALFTWVAAGGNLLVDAAGQAALGVLPPPWRPQAGERVAAGRGQIRLTGSALSDGHLDGLAEPAATTSVNGGPGGGFGFDMSSGNIGSLLQRRSGLRVLSLPAILGALGLYVLVVGPGVRIGLRRLGQLQLTWLAVPLAAIVFTASAVAGGDVLRRGGKATHLTVVETGVAGARSRSYLGQPTRTKGPVVALLPAGWLPGSQADAAQGSATVRTTPGGQRLEAPGQPGGYVVLGAEGPSPVEGRLAVRLDGATGKIEVRNDLRLPLEDVAVFAPGGLSPVGRLEAGASATMDVPSGAQGMGLEALAHTAWSGTAGHLGDADAFSALDEGLRSAGVGNGLLVAGWTDRLVSPVALRSGRPSGTTLVVGRPDGGPAAGEMVGSANTGLLTTRFVVTAGAAYRFSMGDQGPPGAFLGPPGFFPGPTALFPGPNGVVGLVGAAEVLVAGRWVGTASGAPLPEGASKDGVVYLRTGFGMPTLPTLVPV